MESKKNTKGNIVGVLFIIIGMLSLGCSFLSIKGYINLTGDKQKNNSKIISDNQGNNDNQRNNDNQGNNNKQNKNDNKQDKNTGETCNRAGKICSKRIFKSGDELINGTYKLGDKEVNLVMEGNVYSDVSIKINEKEFYKNEQSPTEFVFLEEVYTMGDIILVTTSIADYNTKEILIYDNEGNLLKTIKRAEENNPVMGIVKYEITGDSIYYYRSRLLLQSVLLANDGYQVPIFDYGECRNTLAENKVPEDLLVKVKYIIRYDGNNSLTEPGMLETKTILEYIEDENLKKYCEN